MTSRTLRQTTLSFLFASLAAACGSSETPASVADQSAPLYALQTMIYGIDDEVMSYVALTDSLDVDGESVLGGAREFSSYAFITSVEGKLLVSAGEEPVITQYELSASHDWNETAALSFADYGVRSSGAGFERQWFLDEHTAYLTLDVTSRIVWDPTSFEIRGVKEDTQLETERDGLTLDAAFNRPPQLLKGPVIKPFYYRDAEWSRFGASTAVAIYDPQTHEERDVVDVPCPALEVSSQDERGNTYLSPWTYGPTLSLFGEGPAPCIRRFGPDSKLDADWTPDLSDWTDGRPVGVLRYLGSGQALGTVLHVDEVEGDFSAGYDEELAYELDNHYRLWLFDLEAERATPVEGIENVSFGFNMSVLDGRTFVFVPDSEWSSTTVYELDGRGAAEARFTVTGVVNNWLAVR